MASFDLSSYFPIPNLTAEGYVMLTKVMLRNMPKVPAAQVVSTGQALAQTLAEAQAALVDRVDEDLTTGPDKAFGHFVTAIWYQLRDRLVWQQIYAHTGATELSNEDRVALDWDERTEIARVAARMHRKVFGDGVEFLRLPFSQRVVQMDARLTWLHRDHGIPLEKVVGTDLVTLLDRSQARYDAIVGDRGARTGRSITDRRELRLRLRRQLSTYCGAVGSMAEDGNPASIDVVEAALRPILVARAAARRKLSGSDTVEVEDQFEPGSEFDDIASEFDDEELQDLAQEQGEPGDADSDPDDQDGSPTE